MKEIYYTPHLELRLRLRSINHNIPKRIYLEAQERYYDVATQKLIAVKRLKYKEKVRELAVTYEEWENEVRI